MKEILTATPVIETQARQRLDKFLVGQFSGLSRERVKNLITEGHVVKNDAIPVTSASYKVKEGEVFTLNIPEAKPLDIKAENILLNVLFEDDHLIVINKPAGMTVHPAGPLVSGTLVNALLHHCKNLSGIGGVERPGIVHRLDKGTSGVMVVAKSDASHKALCEMFATRIMERNYLALCYGTPLTNNRHIETQLGRHPKDRKKMAVIENGGKVAITTFEIVKTFNAEASLLKFKLHTGRTHQIRVHAHHINHSVIGDPTYGKRKKISNDSATKLINELDHQMLHAAILGFTHPITNEELRFEEPMPEDMLAIYNALNDNS